MSSFFMILKAVFLLQGRGFQESLLEFFLLSKRFPVDLRRRLRIRTEAGGSARVYVLLLLFSFRPFKISVSVVATVLNFIQIDHDNQFGSMSTVLAGSGRLVCCFIAVLVASECRQFPDAFVKFNG